MSKLLLRLPVAFAALLICGLVPAQADQTLFSQAIVTEGIPAGGPFVPAGTLYDNEQSNATTSLASQDSSGTLTARSADDFVLVDSTCASGQFEISQIRIQMVQQNAAAQAFGVDLFNDDGTGLFPEAGINPFASFGETSQTLLGAFGGTTSIFEAAVNTPGLVLDANTTYWISGLGTNAALNAAAFNNFFAVSNGAGATTDNGVIIAPGAGVAAWTPTDLVVAPPRHAYAFAIDGACLVADVSDIPTTGTVGMITFVALLLGAGFVFMRRLF